MTSKHPYQGSLGSEAIERSPQEEQVPPRPLRTSAEALVPGRSVPLPPW